MESFDQIFELVKNKARQDFSEVVFNLWIDVLTPEKFDNTSAVFSVPSDFQKGVIEKRYSPYIASVLEELMGFPVDVVIESGDEAQSKKESRFPDDLGHAAAAGEYEYTFDTFIVGSGNKFAHAASVAVASKPSGSYNPLFIYGGSGLGKTHLLYAILNEIKKSFADKYTVYIKGEEFANELIQSLKESKMGEFHEKYRSVDILLVDDVQFIGGKTSTQEEFFHTFDALASAGKQIVLTSDRPPKEIKTLDDRLRTRFESGLMADIQPPDYETRIAIIKRKAELLNFKMPDMVAEHIAKKLKSNIRQLEGTVKKIKALNMITGEEPSIVMAENAIRDILNDDRPVPVTIERIIDEVAKTFLVTADDIRSSKRSSAVSKARQTSVYVVREITQMSTSAIGDEFGNRDHSTIVYSLNEVEAKMKKDKRYREIVEDIIKNIRDN